MNNLIKRMSNQLTRDLTYMYSNDKNIPEGDIIFSMVYDFANHLPYSMDIQQEEYVPADFMHMKPYDASTHKFFKWKDSETVYKALISSGDTFRTGVIMQVCAVFQKMLSEQFPHDYALKDSDFYTWGIDEMTPDEDYNRNFFEILKTLPEYYRDVQAAKNNDERRKILMTIYEEMQQNIANRVGGYRRRNAQGEVVEEFKPQVIWQPSQDVYMLYYFNQIQCRTYRTEELKKGIKEQELKRLHAKNISSAQIENKGIEI